MSSTSCVLFGLRYRGSSTVSAARTGCLDPFEGLLPFLSTIVAVSSLKLAFVALNLQGYDPCVTCAVGPMKHLGGNLRTTANSLIVRPNAFLAKAAGASSNAGQRQSAGIRNGANGQPSGGCCTVERGPMYRAPERPVVDRTPSCSAACLLRPGH